MQSPNRSPSRKRRSPVQGGRNSTKTSIQPSSENLTRRFSPSTSVSPERQRATTSSSKKQSLEDINEKLKGVRLRRIELSTPALSKLPFNGSMNSKPSLMTPLDVERNVRKNVKTPKDTKRNKLYHSDLEYIVEKIIHSPYLTKPGDKYPETTFSVPEAIRDFKEQGIIYKNIPENEVPFDFEQSKKRFVEEVVNYKPKYSAKVFLNEEPSETAIAAKKSMSYNWPAALKSQLNGLKSRGGQLESLQSRDESSSKKKNQQQRAIKSDGKSNYNNLPRRIRSLPESSQSVSNLRNLGPGSQTAPAGAKKSINDNPIPDSGPILCSITSRALSAHNNIIPLPTVDNEDVPILPVILKGSKMRILKDLSKNIAVKPISRSEMRNPPLQKKSKSSPILKTSKSETAENFEKYENLEGVGRSEKSQLRKKIGNIETESISAKTTKKEKIKYVGNDEAPEALKPYFFGENELSDFTVTTQTVGTTGATKLSESEMDHIRREIAGHFICPLISGIASKTVNKSPSQIIPTNALSTVLNVGANNSESDKTESTEVEVEVEVDGYVVVDNNQNGIMQERSTERSDTKSNSLDNDTKSTDIINVQDNIDDFEILENANIPANEKNVLHKEIFEDKNRKDEFEIINERNLDLNKEETVLEYSEDGHNLEKKKEEESVELMKQNCVNKGEEKNEKSENENKNENEVFIGIPLDSSVRHRRVSYSEKYGEANLEGNNVAECPLVEGLGYEDAFKPRRSSIKPRLSYEEMRVTTVPIQEGMDGEEEDKMSTTTGSYDDSCVTSSIGEEKGEGGVEEEEEDEKGKNVVEGEVEKGNDGIEGEDIKEQEDEKGGNNEGKNDVSTCSGEKAAEKEIEKEVEREEVVIPSDRHPPSKIGRESFVMLDAIYVSNHAPVVLGERKEEGNGSGEVENEDDGREEDVYANEFDEVQEKMGKGKGYEEKEQKGEKEGEREGRNCERDEIKKLNKVEEKNVYKDEVEEKNFDEDVQIKTAKLQSVNLRESEIRTFLSTETVKNIVNQAITNMIEICKGNKIREIQNKDDPMFSGNCATNHELAESEIKSTERNAIYSNTSTNENDMNSYKNLVHESSISPPHIHFSSLDSNKNEIHSGEKKRKSHVVEEKIMNIPNAEIVVLNNNSDDDILVDLEPIPRSPRDNLTNSFTNASLRSAGKSDLLGANSRSLDAISDTSLDCFSHGSLPVGGNYTDCSTNSRLSSRRGSGTGTGRRKSTGSESMMEEGMGQQDEMHTLDVNAERRKSLQGLVELRMETIPLIESEEEMLKDQKENHKYLLFKNPSGEYSVPGFQPDYAINEGDEGMDSDEGLGSGKSAHEEYRIKYQRAKVAASFVSESIRRGMVNVALRASTKEGEVEVEEKQKKGTCGSECSGNKLEHTKYGSTYADEENDIAKTNVMCKGEGRKTEKDSEKKKRECQVELTENTEIVLESYNSNSLAADIKEDQSSSKSNEEHSTSGRKETQSSQILSCFNERDFVKECVDTACNRVSQRMFLDRNSSSEHSSTKANQISTNVLAENGFSMKDAVVKSPVKNTEKNAHSVLPKNNLRMESSEIETKKYFPNSLLGNNVKLVAKEMVENALKVCIENQCTSKIGIRREVKQLIR